MMFQPRRPTAGRSRRVTWGAAESTSPSFHQWLTPEQYGDRFGITQNDLDKVTAWLQSQGFVIAEVPPSRNLVVFSGTSTQVESALHTEIHNYITNSRKFYANSGEPSVPPVLAGLVAGFRGLNNYPVLPPPALKERGRCCTSGFHIQHVGQSLCRTRRFCDDL